MSKFNVPFFRLRNDRGWTQQDMADAIGNCSKVMIHRIESGASDSTLSFWRRVQKAFNIPNEQMWSLMNGEDYEKK